MLVINDQEFNELKNFIYNNYGIDLSKKRHIIEGRLSNIIVEKGLTNYKDYFNLIYNDKSGKELTGLLNKLTTNHTYFMREESHFEYYRQVVLPYLKQKSKDRSLGIWSAGCSSGEEPATIAMINDDFFGMEAKNWDTRILATDLSERVLDIAKQGVYSKESIEVLSNTYKQRYFHPKDDKVELNDVIKNNIIYKKLNLMDDFKFKRKFDVIFCRNVMIYFDAQTKNRLIEKFYNVTENGGFLFIGHSEYLNKDSIRYKYIKTAIYRKEE